MKRLYISLLMTCLLWVTSTSHAAPGKTYTWQMTTQWSADNSQFGQASALLVKYARELSNGRLIINLVSANETGINSAVFKQVQRGEYALGHATANLLGEQDSNARLFAAIPFGMITPEINAWFYEGGGLELMKKVYQQHGLLAFPGGGTDIQMGGWFKQAISTAQDLQGKRMHIEGIASSVTQTLGVKTVSLPENELLTALESGQIDAVEWAGPAVDNAIAFAKVAPYYYTAWHEPSAELQFLVNQAAYTALPTDLRYALTTAMRLAAYDAYIEARHNNAVQLQALRQRFPRLKIQALPTSVMSALKKSTDKELDALASNNSVAAEILLSIKKYQQQIRLWTRIGDQAYLNNLGL